MLSETKHTATQANPPEDDPSDLFYSTFFGGIAEDRGYGIAVDNSGRSYVTGNTTSTDFPNSPGAFDPAFNGDSDAYVLCLGSEGSTLVYATFLGGSSSDEGRDIAIDIDGQAYVAGWTSSTNFPTTLGAYDTSFNGGTDGFVTRLNPAGSALSYSTFLGYGGNDSGSGIALAGTRAIYVGSTYHNTNVDGYIARLSENGDHLEYNWLIGGSGDDRGADAAVDAAGRGYITGYSHSNSLIEESGTDSGISLVTRAFVGRVSADGMTWEGAPYIGNSGESYSYGVVVDAADRVYVTGETSDSTFPTTSGAFDTTYNGGTFDGFVTRLSPDLRSLEYSTYLGGSDYDYGYDLATDGAGRAYVAGTTHSSDFPTSPNPYDSSYNGAGDAFMARLNAAGTALEYATFLGAGSEDRGYALAVRGSSRVFISGRTLSSDFPTTPGTFDGSYNGFTDGYVTALDISEAAPLAVWLMEAEDGGRTGTMQVSTSDGASKCEFVFDSRANVRKHRDLRCECALCRRLHPLGAGDGDRLVIQLLLGVGRRWPLLPLRNRPVRKPVDVGMGESPRQQSPGHGLHPERWNAHDPIQEP